jgi:hypothetical protein
MIGGPSDSGSFLNNVITSNGSYPICIDASDVGNLSGTGDFSGNAKNEILIYSGNIK